MENIKQVSPEDAKYIDPSQIDCLVMRDGTKIQVCEEGEENEQPQEEFVEEPQPQYQEDYQDKQYTYAQGKQPTQLAMQGAQVAQGKPGAQGKQGQVLRCRGGGFGRILGNVAAGLGAAALGAGLATALGGPMGFGPGPMGPPPMGFGGPMGMFRARPGQKKKGPQQQQQQEVCMEGLCPRCRELAKCPKCRKCGETY